MKTEHGYALGNLAAAIIASVLVIVFFELKEEDSHWIIYPFALAPTLIGAFYWIAKVNVDEDEIRIDYLIPLRKARVIQHGDVESYAPLKGTNGKGKSFMGFLKPVKEPSAILLSSLGTKNFPELSDFLESIYSTENQSHNQSGDDNSE